MRFEFTKYHGAGNDFILMDDRRESFPADNQKLVQLLCDRHFGIGADGLILLREAPKSATTEAPQPATTEGPQPATSVAQAETSFSMLYFNADGRPGSLCGNGGRCVVHFAGALRLVSAGPGSKIRFLASDGVHEAMFLADNRIALAMNPVKKWQELPEITGRRAWVLDTGSPHYVQFTEETPSLDVLGQGRAIRYASPYTEQGINVNFAGPGAGSAHDPLFVRTYERGVEAETLACGTGATAVALALSLLKGTTGAHSIALKALGGLLEVHFVRDGSSFHTIQLIGPAEPVFRGIWPSGTFSETTRER